MCIIQNHFFTKKLIKKGACLHKCNNNCPFKQTGRIWRVTNAGKLMKCC